MVKAEATKLSAKGYHCEYESGAEEGRQLDSSVKDPSLRSGRLCSHLGAESLTPQGRFANISHPCPTARKPRTITTTKNCGKSSKLRPKYLPRRDFTEPPCATSPAPPG